ncbi:MAG TPA: hypothetical protein VFF81_12480 [Noviherbaspirillum sp.]|nr:hypothetical protein [Noviherbaspirillum sp.]
MKYFLLIIVLVGAAWNWYARNTLSEEKVVALYQAQGEAWHKQDGKLLCDQLSNDFQGTVQAVYGARFETETTNKQAQCDSVDAILDLKSETDKRLPAGQQLGWTYRFEIKSINIKDDKKSAEVQVKTHLNMGNMLIIDSEGTDTVALRKGALVFVGGEASAKYSGVLGDALSAAR